MCIRDRGTDIRSHGPMLQPHSSRFHGAVSYTHLDVYKRQVLKLGMADLNLPDELTRLRVKELAEEVRGRFAKKGLSDIFDVLAEAAFLIRKPMETNEISGFSTYFEEQFIVFLNSNFTLGHERFTGAHELYHIIYNPDILKKEKVILDKEKYKEEEVAADIFASEFLMPEDYVKEIFYKIINVDKNSVLPRHIIRMHNYFKVSYKACLLYTSRCV